MKKIFLILFISLTYNFVNSQDLTCKDFHIGKFEMDTKEYGKFIITRTKDNQVESCKSINYKGSFDIVWKDDCTYELSNEQVQIGDKTETNKNIKVTSKIYKIEGDVFFLQVSSNINDIVLEYKMKKIN